MVTQGWKQQAGHTKGRHWFLFWASLALGVEVVPGGGLARRGAQK